MHYQSWVCFAHSRDHHGICLAGKAWHNGGPGSWIRPVGSLGGSAVMNVPQGLCVLDIVDIPLQGPAPLGHQRENHLLSHGQTWRYRGRLSWNDLGRWLDDPEPLWQNGLHSSNGFNDRVLPEQAGTSLRLIRVDRCELVVTTEHRLRVRFRYLGDDYNLALTDLWFQGLCGRQPQVYHLRDVVLCLSLGEVFKGYCYKLVAALLFAKRFL